MQYKVIRKCFLLYTDTNECAKQNGGCSHVCVNDIGSYHCVCPSGYRIAPDGHTCQG